MARQRRSLESLLADVATSARGDRAEVYSTPEMVAVNADMIEDYAVDFNILHPEVKTNLDENTQAVVDINATLDTALPDLDSRLTANKTSLDQAKLDITQAQSDIESVNTIAVNATTAAQTADGKAVTAQSKADQAAIDAAAAQTAANSAGAAASTADGKAVTAQTTANGKSKVIYSTSPASGANTAGDVWFQKDANGVITAQWEGTGGTTWASRTLGSTVIAALDAGKITSGTISAGVLDASIVRAKFIAAGKITASDITASTLTSASGIFGTMDASVLNAGTLNAARIAAGSIAASKLIIGSSFNAMPDPSFRITELTNARFARSSGTWTLDTVLATAVPTVSHLTTTANDGFHYAPTTPVTGSAGAATLQVASGQKITMSVDVETDISAGVRWNIYKHNADGTVAYSSASPYNTAVGQRTLTYVYAVPPGVVALDFALACNTSGVNWKVYGNAVTSIQTGSTLIQDNAITTGHIQANAITAVHIAASTITAAEIATGAITADKIAANAVTATKILAGEIQTNHMAANSINADRLVASSITAAKLAATAIDGKKITGATIVGGEVRTTEATAAITARMGPQSVWDIQGGQTRAGIGFSKVGTNDAYPAGMYSTDGYNVYLQQSNGGGAGGSYISLGVGNQDIKYYSFGAQTIDSRGTVTIGSGMGTVAINGNSGVTINGVDMNSDVATNTQFSWSNGWTHFGSGYGNFQVKEIVPGVVLMQGMAKAGTKTDGVVIGVLPTGLRPNRIQNIGITARTNKAAPNTDTVGLLSVNSNGNVSLFANDISYVTYATISVTYFLNSP